MRLPLVRSGDDDRPIAWWEWPFVPVVALLLVLVLLILMVVSIPGGLLYQFWLRRSERRLRVRLAGTGRFLDWADVEARLTAGEGTLLIEHFSPKGPIREWWTPDNLIAGAPAPLPTSFQTPLADGEVERLQEYAEACRTRYTDVGLGSAMLTQVPRGCRPDPRKCVMLIPWTSEPGIFAGDFDTVFSAVASERPGA
jgi:hypothetical protein